MTTVVSGPAHLNEPGGITIDYITQRLYWADTGSSSIGVVGLDGSGPGILVSALSNAPFQVAVDGDFIYWTNFNSIYYNFVDRMEPGRVYSSQLQEPLSQSFTLLGVVVVNSNRRPNPGTYTINKNALFQTQLRFLYVIFYNYSSDNYPILHFHNAGYRDCLDDTTGCSHFCNVTDDSFSCSCPQGFTLAEDGRRCGKTTLVVAVSLVAEQYT